MKRLQTLVLSLALLVSVGCSSVKPGNDPFVVRSEQTIDIALETFNLFITMERENEAIVAEFSPGIHVYADMLRVESPKWLNSANTLVRTYKKVRTDNNLAEAQKAVALIRVALQESKKYILEIQSHKH